jgi:hypothetical protein
MIEEEEMEKQVNDGTFCTLSMNVPMSYVKDDDDLLLCAYYRSSNVRSVLHIMQFK